MTRASLRPYLRLIPIFRYLSFDQQVQVAQKLVSKRLARGETIDLRGNYANVLCLVIKGKVKVENYLQGGQAFRSELTAGQWTGQALVIGWRHARRTQLAACGGETYVLLLWRQDLTVIPLFRRFVVLNRIIAFPILLLKSIAAWTIAKAANVPQSLSSRVLEHPIVVGTLIALIFFAGFLLFTPPGKHLLADCQYVGVMYQAHLQTESRLRQLERILRIVPDHPLANVELGNMAARSGDFETAMLRYVAVANTNGTGANNAGVLLLNQNDPATALQMFTLSTQLEPDVAVAYQNLGIAYQQLGPQLAAIRAFKEALRVDPNLAVARYHLGMYYLEQGNLVQAATSFERVLEQDRNCAPAYIGLGLVHLGVGDLERAAHAFQEATRLDPDSVVAHFYLRWTWARMGD